MFEDMVPPTLEMWLTRSPQEWLEDLLTVPPGPWMLGVLDSLRDDVTTDAEREKVLVCWDRFIPWAQAQRAHAMVGAAHGQADVAGPFGTDDLGAEVVALLTGDTVAAAGHELSTARLLESELHGVRSALERGEISWRMANDVANATAHLPAWQRETVDQRMVCRWEIDRDITKWRRKLRREVLRVDDNVEHRRKRAIADRHVACWPLPDGMAYVRAELKAEDAATVMAALTAVADTYGAEDRAAAAAAMAANQREGNETDADGSADWVDPESFDALAGPPRRSARWISVALTRSSTSAATCLPTRNYPNGKAGARPCRSPVASSPCSASETIQASSPATVRSPPSISARSPPTVTGTGSSPHPTPAR
jgi:Domain of unknown function (DUF222)